MDKKKLLYIVPHLSTGGLPQYLLKQIQSFKDEFEIVVVEYNCVSMDFVVQRNKIKELCEVITIGEHKSDVVGIIRKEQPHIVHFQEIPETFVDKQYLNQIFDNGRDYNIVITTHSSYTEPKELIYTADKFVLVSEWSRKRFANYFTEIECDIWEYPIEYWNGDKDEAKQIVGFDKEYKHILHVGLFTDGKNQGDIFELAKLCEKENYKVKFHFVGNQAGNFQFYWGPLMENKPNNCIIWGERDDTEKFYKAADLFYFPSKWELNPLAVKEALSYRLPLFLKKLHTYENYYDGISTYISDNQQENLQNIVKELNLEKVIYNNLIKRPNLLKPSFSVNFVDGPYLDVKSPTTEEYEIRFIDKNTNNLDFTTKLKDGHWAKAGRKYYVNWRIEAYSGKNLIFEHNFNPKGKRVYIALESKSLGDTLAWFPIAEEFRKKWDCEVIVSTFSNQFFKEQYPQLQFIEPGETVPNLYAMYRIGWFYKDDTSPDIDLAKVPNDFKQYPLQKTATDILGLEYIEVRPKLKTMYELVQKYKTNTQQWLKNVSDEIFNQKEYVYKEISVQPNDVVVDLGANIGLFAAYSVSKGARKVYSVEPFQPYIEMMDNNLTSLKEKVQIVPYAISDENGVSEIVVNYDDNTILSNVYSDRNWKIDADKKYEIKTIDFDTLLTKYDINTINYLKVDIEGSEYQLFNSINKNVLKGRVEKIAIEYHWSYNNESQSIIDKLKKCGHVVYSFETNSVNKCGKIYSYNPSIYKNKKQISIGIHGTAQSKYWNNDGGWQKVVDWLNDKGYKVVLLSREGDGYMGNNHPTGITQLPNGPIENVIEELQKSEAFIGIGSGLSWVSWATKTPTILISGFSEGFAETGLDTYRITAPQNKCSGCFNRYRLDAGDWNWCPDHKGTERQFECSKSIEYTEVIKMLKKVLD